MLFATHRVISASGNACAILPMLIPKLWLLEQVRALCGTGVGGRRQEGV